MRFYTTNNVLAIALFALSTSSANAFAVPRSASVQVRPQIANTFRLSPLKSTADDDEVQRMREMAARLRQEAASLESKQQEERAQATNKEFRQFDTNNDGEVSLEELKAALEKTFKMDLPQERVDRLMSDFDSNGDGKLQPEEFVGVAQFRNRLEQITAEDRKQALDEQREAQKEAQMTEMMEAQLEFINDRTPTGTDKIVSVLPYLFPLMDGLMYGRFLLGGAEDNPIVLGLGLLYTLYRSIPFGGFICFFALSALGNNLSINRLTRFNIQQAIYLDIALILPGFFGAILSVAGLNLPLVANALGSDAIFLAMLAVIGYASVSSLAGVTPDKVPFISETVSKRMPPSTDELEFDVRTGQFQKKEEEKKDE